MKQLKRAFGILITAAALAFAGCGESSDPASQASKAAPTRDAARHDQHEHDHSHHHNPPHGGALMEVGEEFAHLELVLDRNASKLTLYVLDGEAEKPVRLGASSLTMSTSAVMFDQLPNDTDSDLRTIEFKAAANPLTGETAGNTSEFVSEHVSYKYLSELAGSISNVEIKGQKFPSIKIAFPKGTVSEH